jgi:4-amino-4-deoxy-L-arabinose transferase-like glycosyltransferase
VWLPLPHLLLLPVVAIDVLFYSGIAGAIIGIPCLVGTSILLFLIVRRITNSPSIAFLSGCLFGLNPNVIYISLTPMSEPVFIFLLTFGGYSLLRWLRDDGIVWLWLCAIDIILASLCRYEAWLLVPLISLHVIIKGMTWWHLGNRKNVFRLFLIAGMCWIGIAFWICWNYLVFQDPFKFAHWTYSIAAGTAQEYIRQPLSETLLLFGKAFLFTFGPVVLLVAAIVVIRLFRTSSRKTHWGLLFLYFSLPVFFTLAAILVGFVRIDQWQWNWRYVLTASPFLAVAGGLGFTEICGGVQSKFVRSLFAVALLGMPLVQIALPSVGVATFDDAKRSLLGEYTYSMAIGEQIKSIYKEGSIVLLAGYGQAQRIMISSELPLRQFHIIVYPPEENILESLLNSEQYIVIAKDRTPESEREVNNWLTRKYELLRYYKIRFENEHHILLERKRKE